MHRRNIVLAGATAAFLTSSWLVIGQQTGVVNDAALENAGINGEEWISYNVNWSEQRYSPLTQINDTNVGQLGLGWEYEIPAAQGNPQNRQEATHLVHDGVLYSIAPWSVVYAVDTRTGEEIWRRDPEVDQEIWQSRICCGVVNRGLALYEGKVITPVVDGRLRALEAATGEVLWDTRVSPDNMAYTITMAPRVIKGGRVIIGVSGGEYGVRGFFDAYDVNTGERAWRFYTVPGDPSLPFENDGLEEAAATWEGEWWEIGGGAPVWNGMAYDPDADIVYVGTGQPAPWSSALRGAGDNLFTNTILAVRGATGRLVWYYQTTPGDDWDYDSIANIMLADMEIDGRERQVLMHAPKNGFFYVIDRLTGELLSAQPWVTVSWASGINLRTGRPTINPEARYAGESIRVMPGPGGGHVWPPWSYNPNTGLVYIPSQIGGGYNYAADLDFELLPTDIGPTGRGRMNMGMSFGRGGRGRGRGAAAPGLDSDNEDADGADADAEPAPEPPPPPPALPTIGPTGRGSMISAWDPATQTERWRAPGGAAGFNQGGTLATGGNLVFSSVNTRLLAFSADTGETLLDLPTGLSQMGPPMTFMIDGTQYVMVAGGPPAPPGGRGRDGARGGARGGGPDTPQGPSRLLALTLNGTTPLPGVPPAEPE